MKGLILSAEDIINNPSATDFEAALWNTNIQETSSILTHQ